MPRRVVITGIGFGLPGLIDDAWDRLLAGDSPIHDLQNATLDRWPGRWQVAGPDTPTDRGPLTLLQQVAAPAMRQARLGLATLPVMADPSRTAAVIGASKGGLHFPPGDPLATLEGPFPGSVAPSSLLDDFTAPFPPEVLRSCPVAACATGLVAVVQAARAIRWNHADTVLAGSADTAACPLVLASYRRLGVLAKGLPRPFDLDRDGFVIGEGAGLLVLDDETAAAARGAQPLAVVAGEDLRCDASGLVAAADDGDAVAVTVGNALAQANLRPADIDAVVLHGTGTRQNDRSEGAGLRRVFGPHLDRLPAVSIKGAWGHTLGASGAIEAAIAVQMLRTQTVPPHVGLRELDPACEVSDFSDRPRERTLRHVLKLSLGFGGHVAAVVFSRAETTLSALDPGTAVQGIAVQGP